MSIIEDVCKLDMVDWLKNTDLPEAIPGRDRKDRLIQLLEEAGDYEGRVALNNRLVALQNGEIEQASKTEESEAANLSLLWGMCTMNFVRDNPEVLDELQEES